MTRYGMVLGVKLEEEEKYKQYHAAVWLDFPRARKVSGGRPWKKSSTLIKGSTQLRLDPLRSMASLRKWK
jgi:L-rhamnose mutarotase